MRSPAKTVRALAAANPSGSSASIASIHQWGLSGSAQQTYRRQRPLSVRTREGRYMLFAPNPDCSRVATVVNRSPSSERAITV
jgi:hypothetical protein